MIYPVFVYNCLWSDSESMLIAGVDYQITPELVASYFYADVDNIYRQNYLGFANINFMLILNFEKRTDGTQPKK